MKQSLPNIVAIYKVPCASLVPNIMEKFISGMPVAIYPIPTAIEHHGTASCEAEQEYDNGGYSEKTVLQFTSTEDIRQFPPLAFVIKDAQGQHFIIGNHEAPYPMIEVTKSVDKDTNVYNYKVTFTRQKSLVPCVI